MSRKVPTEKFIRFYQELLMNENFIEAFNKRTGSALEMGQVPSSERDNQLLTAYARKFYESQLKTSASEYIN